jgi:Crp-like helix-turn-helix domain
VVWFEGDHLPSRCWDEAVKDHLPLPQRTLAAMPAVDRHSFNRVLKNLAQRAIAVAYADIQILDPDALARVVAGPGR